jgi:ribosomal protein S18 acetylase RimI-like enzyme
MGEESRDTISVLNHTDADVAERIKRLHDAAYAVEASLLGLDDFPPLGRTLESFAHATSMFVGFLRDGVISGSVEVAFHEPSIYEIASLVVDPRHARQGIGTRLIAHVIKMAGTCRIIVSTAKENHPAIKLYEGLGFQKVDQWLTDENLEIVQLARPANDSGEGIGR